MIEDLAIVARQQRDILRHMANLANRKDISAMRQILQDLSDKVDAAISMMNSLAATVQAESKKLAEYANANNDDADIKAISDRLAAASTQVQEHVSAVSAASAAAAPVIAAAPEAPAADPAPEAPAADPAPAADAPAAATGDGATA